MILPDPVEPSPQVARFKEEMAQSCTSLAIIAREIGRSKPAWGADITEHVNSVLDKSIQNVARLPDELAFGILQVSGAHIHTIGRLLLDPFTSPATIAPLARSAVEYSALLMFLNREESPEVRTVRNARALRMGMKIDKVHRQKVAEDMYTDLSKVVERYTRKHIIPDLKHDEVKYKEMVVQMAGELVGSDLYDKLSSYAHHNPWKAFSQIILPDYNPDSLELDSLLFAYRSTVALSGASFTLLPFRDQDAVNPWREKLDFETSTLLQIGEQMDLFLSSNKP